MTTRTRTATVAKKAAATPARTTRARKTAETAPAPTTRTRTRKTAAPVEDEAAKSVATRTPRKRTAPAKVAEPVAEVQETAKPTRSRKSASSDDTPETVAQNIAALIASGALDSVLEVIDIAIEGRADFFEEQKKKETAAKRAATRAANKSAPAQSAKIAEKLAPVSRAKKAEPAPSESASDGLKQNGAYVVAGLAKIEGMKVRFLGYTDATGKKASVEVREDYTGSDNVERKTGKKVVVPVTKLMDGRAYARKNK